MTKPLTKEQKQNLRKITQKIAKETNDKIAKAKQEGLGLESTKMKLSGFNGDPLKQTTPKNIQDAANEYFEKKLALEKCKEAVDLELEHIGAEMAAENVQSVVVRDLDGEPKIVRVKKSSKLEIKKIK